MSFVRIKRQGWRTYHYLVRNERVEGRVRQRVIAYLGEFESVEVALHRLDFLYRVHHGNAQDERERAEQWRKKIWWGFLKPTKYDLSNAYKMADFKNTKAAKIQKALKNAKDHDRLAAHYLKRLTTLKKALKI
jgi:hypothetical protein